MKIVQNFYNSLFMYNDFGSQKNSLISNLVKCSADQKTHQFFYKYKC